MAISSSRPALLFLCQTLPFPPDGGVTVRTFNVLRQLAQDYDVHVLCFFRRSIARSVDSAADGLRAHVQAVDVFPIEQEYSALRLLRDHLGSTLAQRVYTRYAHDNRNYRARLRELVARKTFSLVHLDSLDLSGFLDELTHLPVVCVHHNVESQLLERRSAMEHRSFRRGYFRMQSKLMRKEEAFWCPKVALNVVCSPDDLLALKHIAPGAPLAVVPNGADTDEFVPGSSLGTGVVFVGGMTWFPNKDALEYFSSVIMPELAAIGCVPSVEWVGRELPGARVKFAELGISLTGYVDDVKPHVAAARCFIVPLRVGGGTRLKILSAWAMGKAVVTTSIGCEGLDTRDGWNALVRDDPREFAAAVKLVLEDDELAARLGANARATAEKTYSWSTIGAKMRTLYASLTDADARSRGSNG